MYWYVIWLGFIWKGLIRMLLGAFSYQTWRNTVTIPSKSYIYVITYIYNYIYIYIYMLYDIIYNYIYIFFFRGSEGCGKFQHVSGFGGFSTCWHLAEPVTAPLIISGGRSGKVDEASWVKLWCTATMNRIDIWEWDANRSKCRNQ
jgi:hypothetical protein